MPDARAAVRVVDELLWKLRRAGIDIATSQAIDAVRAVRAVGFASKDVLREAMAAVVVTRRRDRVRFEEAFDAFFAGGEPAHSLWDRLDALGFSATERDVLRQLLDAHAAANPEGALATLVHRGSEVDALLRASGARRLVDGMQSPLQSGFFAHRLVAELGVGRAHRELGPLTSALIDALGSERGEALAKALKAELARAAADVRQFVDDTVRRREADREATGQLLDAPLIALSDAESEDVRRAIRAFVHNLRGGERVRRKRAKLGRIDAHRTLRRAMRSGGVPFTLIRKARRRDKPRLIIVCDVSDSVRNVSRFTLELTYAAQELFEGTRSFVFVSELGETTELFATLPVEAALTRAYQGEVAPVTHNSNYGRMLTDFRDRVLPDVDRRTTVVIVGDGRTNYQAPADGVLDAIRHRARALVWLCPEPRSTWATGDSAMPRYAAKCTATFEVRTARDLEEAARRVLSFR